MLHGPGPCLLDSSAPVNGLAPRNRGLVSWWKVLPQRYGGARWLDMQGGLHGTLRNMAPSTATAGWAATTRAGGWGELRFLAEQTTSVDIGASTRYDFPNTTFSVAFWVKATAPGYCVARRSFDGAAVGGWFVRLNADGTLSARLLDLGNTSAGNRATVSDTFFDGAWHHVLAVLLTDTGVLANTDVTLYHNGVLDQSARTDSGVGPYDPGPYNLTFGAVSEVPADSYLTGALDDIRIAQGTLTASDAWSLYTASRLGYPEECRWTGLPLVVPTWAPPPPRRSLRWWRRAA